MYMVHPLFIGFFFTGSYLWYTALFPLKKSHAKGCWLKFFKRSKCIHSILSNKLSRPPFRVRITRNATSKSSFCSTATRNTPTWDTFPMNKFNLLIVFEKSSSNNERLPKLQEVQVPAAKLTWLNRNNSKVSLLKAWWAKAKSRLAVSLACKVGELYPWLLPLGLTSWASSQWARAVACHHI